VAGKGLENASSAAADADLALIRAAALLASDPRAAARQATLILDAHPGHAGAALLRASAQRACGELPAAVSGLTALVAANPGSAAIRLELGRALRAQGSAADAQAALERATELAPNLAEAWRELSLVHAARGENAACDRAYARFRSLTADDPGLREAGAALASRRWDAAERHLRGMLERAPENVDALLMLAEVATAREDYRQAERLLNEALRLAPGDSRARVALAELMRRQFRGEPMLPLLTRLLASEPGNRRYRMLQAAACYLLGDTDRALQVLRDLVRELPHDGAVWLQYADTLRMAGQQREAIEAYRSCVALEPESGEAWFALGNLKTVRLTAQDVAALRTQLARENLRHEDRVYLEFTLGKALEDAGDFSDSFAHYARGNQLQRSVVQFDNDQMTRLAQRTRALYTARFFAERAGWGCASREPIFIVGLPRSGSTLLEQILASHSQVEGTRELTDVPAFAIELGIQQKDEPGNIPAYPQSVAQLTQAQLAALGERYLAQTRAHRRSGRPHFVDKQGANFLHIGLIQLMLPNARIIDARRSALGCCFANFKQHFPVGFSVTTSLEDLGLFYREYVGLMAHFDAVLPGRIHRVCYEDLVANLEAEVRRLLDYCGLPFEEQCLSFHETQRAVQTPSSEQVRQPLYTEAVDQWRNYEPWLGPLKEALGDLAR
jgi:tetratricopeptide (TPR) repeat protein